MLLSSEQGVPGTMEWSCQDFRLGPVAWIEMQRAEAHGRSKKGKTGSLDVGIEARNYLN